MPELRNPTKDVLIGELTVKCCVWLCLREAVWRQSETCASKNRGRYFTSEPRAGTADFWKSSHESCRRQACSTSAGPDQLRCVQLTMRRQRPTSWQSIDSLLGLGLT